MYLKSYNTTGNTTLKSNIDFMIYTKNVASYNPNSTINIFMCSICDIGVNVRGVVSNFNSIDEHKVIQVKSYDDITLEYDVNDIMRRDYNVEASWQYKITKNTKYTHGIIYNKKLMQDCVIDYDGNKKYEVLSRYINDKFKMPITADILKLIDTKGNLLHELEVYSQEPSVIKAYYVNESIVNTIRYRLVNTDLQLDNSSESMNRWDGIETVNDYILEFRREIQEVLDRNIKVRFNQEKDIPDMKMFDYKRKPYKGQVPLIESAKRTLMDEKRVIITAEMSCGKTTIGTMANDLYMQEKGKDKYITLVVVPNATLKKWKNEIYNILGNKVNIEICKSTVEYIRLMNSYTYDKPLYIITSKETAKLGYRRKPAVIYETRTITINETDSTGRYIIGHSKYTIKDLAICPHCGMPMINMAKKKNSSPEEEYLTKSNFNTIKKSNYKCPNEIKVNGSRKYDKKTKLCNEVLWTVDKVKTSKTSLMDYCHRKHIVFDSVIYDEFHNEKNISSGTGSAFAQILKMSKVKILLSGTMNNGNVSSIFPLLMRLIPYKMFKDGYTLKDMDKFIQTYGSLKAVKNIKDDEQRMTSRTMFKDSDYSEIAGINAIVYTKYLSDIIISATIDDLGIDMVDYKEYPVEVQVEDELMKKYQSLSSELKSTIPYNFEMYNSSVIRHYINNPFGWESMIVNKPTPNGVEKVEIQFPNMNPNIILNKEQQLLELVQSKLQEGRKCLVFTDFTGGHSQYQKSEVIDNRLMRILKENNINAKTLKSSIKPIDRMEYINKNSDTEVWITNPILVKEGLDLVDYPIIIFYNMNYEIMSIMQASRRAWRTIQTVNCETYYFYCKDTVEEKVMKSITLKKIEMGAIEGKYNLDDFDIVKRTASTLGNELYNAINIGDSMNSMNKYQVKAKNVKLHPIVEKLYE